MTIKEYLETYTERQLISMIANNTILADNNLVHQNVHIDKTIESLKTAGIEIEGGDK